MALDFNDPINMIVVGALSISVVALIIVGGWAAISSLPESDKEFAGNKSLDNIYDDAKGNDALSNAFMTSKIDISTETNSCSFLVTYKGNRGRRVECTTGCQGGPDDPNSKFCRQYIYKGGDEGNETGDLGQDLLDETYVSRRKAAQSDDDEDTDITPTPGSGSSPGCSSQGIDPALGGNGDPATDCSTIDRDSPCVDRDQLFEGWGGNCSSCYAQVSSEENALGLVCMANPNLHNGNWGWEWATGIIIMYIGLIGVPLAVCLKRLERPFLTWNNLLVSFILVLWEGLVITTLVVTSRSKGGIFIENIRVKDQSPCVNSEPADNCDTKG